jgi:hypothetical protein
MEDAYASVMALVQGERCEGRLGRMLAEDVEAIASCAFRSFRRAAHSATHRSFRSANTRHAFRRTVADAVVPVPSRPFPETLRDDDLLKPRPHPSDFAARVWGAIAVAGVATALYRMMRKRR